jgi:hypothetical protein
VVAAALPCSCHGWVLLLLLPLLLRSSGVESGERLVLALLLLVVLVVLLGVQVLLQCLLEVCVADRRAFRVLPSMSMTDWSLLLV